MPGHLDERDSDQRKAILQGVFNENLRLADKRHLWDGPKRVPVWRRQRLLLPVAFLLVMAFGLVAGRSGWIPLADITPENRHQSIPAASPMPSPEGPWAASPVRRPSASHPLVMRRAPEALDPAIYAAPLASAQVPLKKLFGLSVRTIVIDAGHGGADPGAIGKMETREKDITLDVARRLRDKLAEHGHFRIRLIRDKDTTISLNRRVKYANSLDADLFLSIHVNSLPNVDTNGIETYYFGPHTDKQALKLAERENQGSAYTVSEFEDIVRNMRNTIKFQESRRLARSIQRSLLAHARQDGAAGLDRGIKTAPLVLLLGVKAPGVLAEISCISSPEAEQDLRTDAYLDQVATDLAFGITDYLGKQVRGDR